MAAPSCAARAVIVHPPLPSFVIASTQAVTIFVATALNLTMPTNFEPFYKGVQPISDDQIITNFFVMMFGELVLADGLLFLISRIERFVDCNVSVATAMAALKARLTGDMECWKSR